MFKHIFLTGEDDELKSNMISQLLIDKTYSGFQVCPYTINNQEKGHYLHSYIAIEDYDNDLVFSIKMNANKTVFMPDIWDYFGSSIIASSRSFVAPIIKMDNLALTKQKCLRFLDEFDRCLYSQKHIIGSLACMNDEISALVFTNNESCILEINQENQVQMLENLKRIIASWSE